MLKITNKETLQKEKEIQKNIYKCIDEFKSFVFYAGAGAGKTYALKESIKYILKHKREELKRKNQKIICITYTNVAVNEIKRRIGNK
jgi:DNA helicase-2/ATP-dependent DNA helicase PcrA